MFVLLRHEVSPARFAYSTLDYPQAEHPENQRLRGVVHKLSTGYPQYGDNLSTACSRLSTGYPQTYPQLGISGLRLSGYGLWITLTSNPQSSQIRIIPTIFLCPSLRLIEVIHRLKAVMPKLSTRFSTIVENYTRVIPLT